MSFTRLISEIRHASECMPPEYFGSSLRLDLQYFTGWLRQCVRTPYLTTHWDRF